MNQKSIYSLSKTKKGYVLYDFIFALVIFIMIFFMIYINFIDYKEELDVKNKILILNTDASNLCYLLVDTTGTPENWNDEPTFNSSIHRIGLKNVNYTISESKLDKLNQTDLKDIVDSFELSKKNIYIGIKSLDNSIIYLEKGAKSETDSVYVGNSICTGYLQSSSEYIKVMVEVWK